MKLLKSLRGRLLVAVVTLGFATLVYWPGLSGPFLFDDQNNIVRNGGIRVADLSFPSLLQAALSTYGSRPVHRPLARLSFGLNYYFADQSFRARAFKITNLAIHLFNGLVVFFLVSLLARALRERDGPPLDEGASSIAVALTAWLAMALWVVHPIQLTSVLYVVQRMTSMAGAAVLFGLLVFTAGRIRCMRDQSHGALIMGAGVVFGTGVGIASKENAVLLPLLACLVDYYFFPWRDASERTRRQLRILYVSFAVVLGLAILAIASVSFYVVVNIYDTRNFTLFERLLTQPRVLLYYIGLFFFPNVRHFSIFHDDILLSEDLITPWSTLPALIVWGSVIMIAVRGIRRRSLFSFGVLWFLVAHSIESSFIGLELVHEHRNYVPTVGLAIATAFYVQRFLQSFPRRKNVYVIAIVGFLLVCGFATYTRSTAWATREGILYFAVRNHPSSYRAQMGYGALLQQHKGDIYETYDAYLKAADLNRFNILPVVRLQRIVSGLINQFERDTLRQHDVENLPDQLNIYSDNLYLNLEYVRKLDLLLSDELTHRISFYALDAESSVGINELRRCIGAKLLTCPPAERVEQWVEIALGRETLMPIQRAALLLIRARLLSYAGDLEGARRLMEETLGLTSSDLDIFVEIALLLIEHDDFDGAEQILDDVQAEIDNTGKRRADVVFIREIIKNGRSEMEKQHGADAIDEPESLVDDADQNPQ